MRRRAFRILFVELVCFVAAVSPSPARADALRQDVAEPKRVDTGVIDGAAYRIEFPEHWSGTLVLYAHGYEMVQTPRLPVTFKGSGAIAYRAEFLSRGAAFAETAYRTQGWAVKEALADIEALRRYFIQKYGKPTHTYLNGHSMGGFLTVVTLEREPEAYDGGLALCGPYLPALTFMGDSLFPMLVTFDALFPGVLHLTSNGMLDLEAAHGPVSVLVNCASITRDSTWALDILVASSGRVGPEELGDGRGAPNRRIDFAACARTGRPLPRSARPCDVHRRSPGDTRPGSGSGPRKCRPPSGFIARSSENLSRARAATRSTTRARSTRGLATMRRSTGRWAATPPSRPRERT